MLEWPKFLRGGLLCRLRGLVCFERVDFTGTLRKFAHSCINRGRFIHSWVSFQMFPQPEVSLGSTSYELRLKLVAGRRQRGGSDETVAVWRQNVPRSGGRDRGPGKKSSSSSQPFATSSHMMFLNKKFFFTVFLNKKLNSKELDLWGVPPALQLPPLLLLDACRSILLKISHLHGLFCLTGLISSHPVPFTLVFPLPLKTDPIRLKRKTAPSRPRSFIVVSLGF